MQIQLYLVIMKLKGPGHYFVAAAASLWSVLWELSKGIIIPSLQGVFPIKDFPSSTPIYCRMLEIYMCNCMHLYRLCANFQLWTDKFSFTDAEVVQGVIMDTADIKFFNSKARTPKEMFGEATEIYGEDSLSYNVVKKWHHPLRSSRTLIELALSVGQRHLTVVGHAIWQVEAIILKNCHIIICNITKNTKISVGSGK